MFFLSNSRLGITFVKDGESSQRNQMFLYCKRWKVIFKMKELLIRKTLLYQHIP